MSEGIRTAAVIGSGVMGSAIAAQFAGAGVVTHLLDIVPRDLQGEARSNPSARNRLASEALVKALKMKPAPFYVPEVAREIQVGNLEDHLERLASCDLVIEAVVEDMAIKRRVFESIAPHISSSALLASNTSGLSIAKMAEALPQELQPRFVVLHFFNPVRYMHLVEIAGAPATSEESLRRAARFAESLGKGVVFAKDTTNFVANRIGAHGMLHAIHLLDEVDMGIEAMDAVIARPMARSPGAAFKTADIVGLDTFVHVANNCYESLVDDPEREVFKIPAVVEKLVQAGRLGRKSGAGFYKKVGADILVYDPKTDDYRPKQKVRFDSVGKLRNFEDPGARLKGLLAAKDEAAQLAWKLVARNLSYCARLVGEISDDLVSIDRAMRWGYNWELGPFEGWDAIGVAETVERMLSDGYEVPEWVREDVVKGSGSFYGGDARKRTYHDVPSKQQVEVPKRPTQLSLAGIKVDSSRVVKKNLGASLVDLGDGVLCVEVHTKMNTLDADVIAMLNAGVTEAEKNYQALLIANDGTHFGAGANLFMIYAAAQQKAWDQVSNVIRGLQQALQGLRYARVPVVAAPFQYTLGGGAELAMAADCCQAHAETYMGLVELGVGLVPAGGGCLRMVERHTASVQDVAGADLLPFIGQASMTIATAKVATSAEEAKQLRLLQPTDGISLDRSELLYHAKHRALGMAQSGYRPPRPRRIAAAGQDAAATIGARIWSMVEGHYASPHDALLAGKVAHILCGGNVAQGTLLSEQDYLDLEHEAFLSLCGEKLSLDRIEHMLKNNKPLRN